MHIIIKEITKSHMAISYDDGKKCLKVILKYIDNEQEIILDFQGVDFVITAFLNPIIGDLIIQKGKSIMEKIEVDNANKNIVDKIKLVRDDTLLKRKDILEE